MKQQSTVSRPFFLAVVIGAALGAVLLKDRSASSFSSGIAVGAGLVFVGSFLRNPRNPSGPAGAGREFSQDDQNPDR